MDAGRRREHGTGTSEARVQRCMRCFQAGAALDENDGSRGPPMQKESYARGHCSPRPRASSRCSSRGLAPMLSRFHLASPHQSAAAPCMPLFACTCCNETDRTLVHKWSLILIFDIYLFRSQLSPELVSVPGPTARVGGLFDHDWNHPVGYSNWD
jgi:hypothetical protein